jgi:hypothetical protein
MRRRQRRENIRYGEVRKKLFTAASCIFWMRKAGFEVWTWRRREIALVLLGIEP